MNKRQQSKMVGPSHQCCYRRGLRYRQILQNTARRALCDACRTCLKDAGRLLPLSQIDPGFRIADALAHEYGINCQHMREDCSFAAAVDTIAFYCGDQARGLLLEGNQPLPRKTIMQISRMAPTRQRYEIEQVRQGRRPLSTKGVHEPVFDTVDFAEIKSRLRRTQGKLGVCLRALEGLPEAVRPTRVEKAILQERLSAIGKDTRLLLRGVRAAPEGVPCPCELRRQRQAKSNKKSASKVPTSYRQIIGLLGQAQSWPKKCVRDLSTLLQHLLPLAAEKAEIRRQGHLVIDRANLLRHLLGIQ